MTNIIVIGGGIIGVSTAFRLAQAGARVTLLEATTLAGGTSSTSFAWMNANNKAPIAYHRINLAGMAEHVRLREELGYAPWLHDDGNIVWEDTPAATEPAVPIKGESLKPRVARLRDWGYPVELLDPAEVASLVPDLVSPPASGSIAYFPSEGYIDVRLLVASLAHAARTHGATIRTNTRVTDIISESSRIVGVRTDSGERLSADIVVSCTGRWTDQVTALIGTSIPMAPTRGLLVVSSPVTTSLRQLVHTPGVNLRPDGGSRILMASYDIDLELRDTTTDAELNAYAQDILDRATRVLPALAGGTVESIMVGTRAIPRDDFPVVGPIDGVEGFHVITTHSGVTMGPFLGRVAAREILGGTPDDRLTDFRPARLLGNTPATA